MLGVLTDQYFKISSPIAVAAPVPIPVLICEWKDKLGIREACT